MTIHDNDFDCIEKKNHNWILVGSYFCQISLPMYSFFRIHSRHFDVSYVFCACVAYDLWAANKNYAIYVKSLRIAQIHSKIQNNCTWEGFALLKSKFGICAWMLTNISH